MVKDGQGKRAVRSEPAVNGSCRAHRESVAGERYHRRQAEEPKKAPGLPAARA